MEINLDLLTVGISVAGIGLLGFLVYFSDRKSITNKIFLVFSIITIVWGVINYLNYQITNDLFVLWAIRLVIFFAVLQALSFFVLMLVFPDKVFVFPSWFKKIILPVASLAALLTLTPIVFSSIIKVPGDLVAHPVVAPGIVIFVFTAVLLVVFGFIIITRKFLKAQKELRSQLRLVIIGASIMFALIIVFNLIFLLAFNTTRFVPMGSLFVLPFVLFAGIAILKQRLFNVKVAGTAIMVFLLSIVLFLEIIFTNTLALGIFRSSVFLLVLIFGISLIKSVIKEVEQREKLAELNISLQDLIQQRESLMHLINHKVKGSFTHSKYTFAGILDGMFGPISPEIKKAAENGLDSDEAGIRTVDLILNAANLQKGTVVYDIKPIDFKKILEDEIVLRKEFIEKKGLKLETNITNENCQIQGDVFWIKEVVNNLLDNSINYTKEGKIVVFLEKKDKKILFAVKDTGIGISDEDKKKLFTEGGRGKDSVKTNTSSTGYGLYSVRLIVEAYKGRVWGESAGSGQGSAFYAEFDAL